LKFNLYQDAADLKMVLADVCINIGQPRLSTIAAVDLGETLEAAKNYTDAAKVYMEVANSSFPINAVICPEIRARTYAGLSFKRPRLCSSRRALRWRSAIAGNQLDLG